MAWVIVEGCLGHCLCAVYLVLLLCHLESSVTFSLYAFKCLSALVLWAECPGACCLGCYFYTRHGRNDSEGRPIHSLPLSQFLSFIHSSVHYSSSLRSPNGLAGSWAGKNPGLSNTSLGKARLGPAGLLDQSQYCVGWRRIPLKTEEGEQVSL